MRTTLLWVTRCPPKNVRLSISKPNSFRCSSTSRPPQPVPDSTPAPHEALSSRYGAGKQGKMRVLWRVLLIVGGIIFVATALWAAFNLSRADVTWKDLGYSVHGPESVTVDFNVTKDPGTSARCTLEALNAHYAQVGLLDVDIPAADRATTRHSATLATQELAVTGIVNTCEIGRAHVS